MHITTSAIISVICSLTTISHSLPLESYNHHRFQERKVSYSVVPVDGSAPTTNQASPITIIETVTQSSGATKTVTVAPSSVPPQTEMVYSTETLVEAASATTVRVTITPESLAADPTTTTSIIVVNPSETSTSVLLSLGPGPKTTLSATATPSVPQISTISLALGPESISSFSTSPILASTTPLPLGPGPVSISLISTVSTPLPASTATSIAETCTEAAVSTSEAAQTTSFAVTSYQWTASSSTHTYDDGQWHTTYRTWNASSTASLATNPIASLQPVPTTLGR